MFGIFRNKNSNYNVSAKKRVAYCIGINDYPGTRNDLRGCVNDAIDWASLTQVHGYTADIIKDRDATVSLGKNILKELVNDSNKYGKDFQGILTFSGHGTHVPDLDGDEENGRDEALCMYDGLIIDDEIREILSSFNKNARLWIVADCCHSGTITRNFLETLYDEELKAKPRYMPPSDDLLALMNIRQKSYIVRPQEEDMNEILLTGSLDSEYSWDAFIDGKFQGAMSYHAKKIIRNNPGITFDKLHAEVRKFLPSRQFPQTPQLEGREQNKVLKIF